MFDKYVRIKKRAMIQSRMNMILLDRVLVTPKNNPLTLSQIANKFGVGAERIRQQEAKAIERLRYCIMIMGINSIYDLTKAMEGRGLKLCVKEKK